MGQTKASRKKALEDVKARRDRASEEYLDRANELRNNRAVRRPISKLDSKVLKKASGRPRAMTPRVMLNRINKYFEHCEEVDDIPSISGMILYLKLYKNAFYNYLKDPDYEEILEQARLVIKTWIETDIYKCEGRTEGKIAYMKNIHGWADKIETKNETEVKQVLDVSSARAKIESLAPMLLEVLKNSNVVDQIAHKEVIDAEVIDNG